MITYHYITRSNTHNSVSETNDNDKNGIQIIDVEPMPDWGEFSHFVEQFIAEHHATIIEQDYGMDRHQIRYQQGSHEYLLQFEHYSESIWIEAVY